MDARQTEELYEDIFMGCGIAQAAIEALLRRAEQKELCYDLQRLLNRYRSIGGRAKQGLQRYGSKPSRMGVIPRTGNCIQVYWKTMFDRSAQNMAHIVIRGFQTGERELADYRHKFINAEERAKSLCADMLAMQRQEKMCFAKYLN